MGADVCHYSVQLENLRRSYGTGNTVCTQVRYHCTSYTVCAKVRYQSKFFNFYYCSRTNLRSVKVEPYFAIKK